MITIDCRDVVSIKNELLVYVADQMAAIPTLKHDQFTLSTLDDDDVIDSVEVISAIKEYLEFHRSRPSNFAVISNHDVINIRFNFWKSLSNLTLLNHKMIMFSCTHCGFVTMYEVELNYPHENSLPLSFFKNS